MSDHYPSDAQRAEARAAVSNLASQFLKIEIDRNRMLAPYEEAVRAVEALGCMTATFAKKAGFSPEDYDRAIRHAEACVKHLRDEAAA